MSIRRRGAERPWLDPVDIAHQPVFVADYENPPGWIGRRPDMVRIERASWGNRIVVYRWMTGLQCWRARYFVGSPTSCHSLRTQWIMWSENRRGKRHSR